MEEIAGILGIKKGTVLSRIHRGREQLARNLGYEDLASARDDSRRNQEAALRSRLDRARLRPTQA
jgi:hypothetical protein